MGKALLHTNENTQEKDVTSIVRKTNTAKQTCSEAGQHKDLWIQVLTEQNNASIILSENPAHSSKQPLQKRTSY